jgi:hypothetical protein
VKISLVLTIFADFFVRNQFFRIRNRFFHPQLLMKTIAINRKTGGNKENWSCSRCGPSTWWWGSWGWWGGGWCEYLCGKKLWGGTPVSVCPPLVEWRYVRLVNNVDKFPLSELHANGDWVFN